MLNANAEPLIP